MDKELKKMFCILAKLQNKKPTELLEEAMRQMVAPYATFENGEMKLPVKNGIYLEGSSELEKVVAENEGREVEIKRIPCHVLEKTSMFGQSYVKILVDGQLRKVPASKVEMIKEDEDGKQ